MRTGLIPGLALLAQVLLLWTPPCQGQIRFPNRGGSRLPNPQTPRPVRPIPQTEPQGCNCLSKGECPRGFGQLQIVCLTETGDKGICCIPQEGIVLTRVGFSSSDFQPMNIPSNVVNTGYEMGESFFNDLLQLEQERLRNQEFLARGEPARGHAFFFERSPSSKRTHDLAYTLAQSSREIAEIQHLTPEQSFFGLPEVRIGSQQMGFQCPMNQLPRCDASSRYRTIDGSCNNLGKPLLGRSETGFGRIAPPLYSDGIMEVRMNGVDGKPLPNVRVASSTVLLDVDIPDAQFALGVMQWAQFMDHDLALTPFDDMDGEAIRCCIDGRLVSPMPASCFPITIPSDDGFFGPRGQGCINFVRSMLALNENCALGPVEQQNVLTHYVDGSMIYGSTPNDEFRVVDRTTGFMRTSNNNLPPTNRSIDCEARIRDTICFAGGDSRINEQPALTTMHTLWVREHNRIATTLKRLNPRWSAEKLYQETRRIIIAQVEHIAYNEWLPIIIGQPLMDKLGINTLRSGYRQGYNPSVDPSVYSEFSTAAFRFGHSLVQGLFRLITNTGRLSTMRLRDTFNGPHIIQRNPELIDQFVNSLTIQNIQTLDNMVTQELSNHLFQTPAFNFGMDLMSLNLQRGRDHAISTYNVMRQFFGIGKANTFVDLLNTTPPDLVRRIQTVYRSVDDIDLWIGGMTEKSSPGALLGPTFGNIVGKQFQNAQNGDRFFYDNGGQAGSFTPQQLQEIRKASIARIYCENSNVGEMQPLAFRGISPNNPRVPCSSNTIPSINLQVFKE